MIVRFNFNKHRTFIGIDWHYDQYTTVFNYRRRYTIQICIVPCFPITIAWEIERRFR